MQLITIFEDKDDAENAEAKLTSECKIVTDREDNQVIYKLFAKASWNVFYQLDMFNLKELKKILELRKSNQAYDKKRHAEIIKMMNYSARSFSLEIPEHWL